MGRTVGEREQEGGARRAWALPPTVVIMATLLATVATAPVRPASWSAMGTGGAPGRPVGSGSAPLTTVAYTSTGQEQRFVVPTGVTRVRVVAVGGRGRGGSDESAGAGGRGAVVTATLVVTPGLTLYVEVGGDGALGDTDAPGGFNGGGKGSEGNNGYDLGGGGGGASDVQTCARAATTCATLRSRLVVAGGGGGGGAAPANGGNGGDGGAAGRRGEGGGGRYDPEGTGGSPGVSRRGGAGGAAGDVGEDGGPGTGGDAGRAGGGGGGGTGGGGGGGGGYYGGGAAAAGPAVRTKMMRAAAAGAAAGRASSRAARRRCPWASRRAAPRRRSPSATSGPARSSSRALACVSWPQGPAAGRHPSGRYTRRAHGARRCRDVAPWARERYAGEGVDLL